MWPSVQEKNAAGAEAYPAEELIRSTAALRSSRSSRSTTPIVMTRAEHTAAVKAAIAARDDAAFRRLVFDYRLGQDYAVLATYEAEIIRTAAELVSENGKKFAGELYPNHGGPIPAKV